jgi:hypothetical protein
MDEPDLSLKQGGLQESEHEPTAKSVGDTPYSSAKTFEELPISQELLQVGADCIASSKRT